MALVAALGSGALALTGAPSAGAATQLGQVSSFSPSDTAPCELSTSYVQAGTATLPYSVPAPGGVITMWSHRAKVEPSTGRLQVWRPAGGSNFTLVGRSALESFTPNTVNSFAVRIPVSAGDRLGLRDEDDAACGYSASLGDLVRGASGSDPLPGAEANMTESLPSFLLNVSAVLEPDCDNDGFGDETQDPELIGPNCPPPIDAGDSTAPETTITKGPKDKTKKKTATFEFTGTDARAIASFQCKLDAGTFAPCTSPHTVKVKKGKHTFQVQAIDQAGNVGSPATDTWKVKKRRKK